MLVRWLSGGRVCLGQSMEADREYEMNDADAASVIAQGHAVAVIAPPPGAPPEEIGAPTPAVEPHEGKE